MKYRKIVTASIIGGILAGCGADDQAYDTVERDSKEVAVSQLKDGRWFYVPTTGAAPRFALNQFPFLQGMGRYVELCYSKQGLEVRSYDKNYPDTHLPKDENNYCNEQEIIGSDDSVNFAHVLTIPGEFFTYRCAEDSYGDCTNKEEVNEDASLDYTAKTHFLPEPEKLEVSEFNWEDFYGVNEGVEEQGTPKIVSWEFDPKKGVLNFELERTLRIDMDKISSYINFSTRAGLEDAIVDGAFKSRFYYSLVHEDALASKDYQPVLYPVGDENDIGFFTTSSKQINPVTNKYDREVVYLTRFNPNLDSIKYYLSDNFFEDKNKLFLDATIQTVNKMNKALELFGTDSGMPKLEIANQTEAAGVHPGDLRYNIINLIDEPLANGLLGYGPSVGNPTTGEIIKAHVNQYSGVARTGVPFYWDNLVRFYNRNQLDTDGLDPLPVETASLVTDVNTRVKQLATLSAVSKLQGPVTSSVPELARNAAHQAERQQPTKLLETFSDDLDFEKVAAAEENRLAFWAENNVYPIEASWVSSTSKAMLDNLKLKDDEYFNIDVSANTRTLRRWKELPQHLRAIVADAITIATYSNTLVHELGHNLGLRHNFKASNDKANYYTLEQAHLLGLNNIPAYSSTMDYAPSMLDEVPTWGLYDIAAFKFAYARKVETVQDSPVAAPAPVAKPSENASNEELAAYSQYELDLKSYQNTFAYKFGTSDSNESLIVCGEVAPMKDQPGKSLYNCDFSRFDAAANAGTQEGSEKTRYGSLHYLDNVEAIERKQYAFCTDGNVSLNSDCNRFDEGTSLEEIVSYQWQSYLDSYDRRNLASYGTTGLYNSDYPSYLVRRFREMTELRDKLEDLERIDGLFTGGEGKPGDYLGALSIDPTYCRQGDSTSRWFCDYAWGAQKSAAFFLDVLRTPEHQCVLEDSNGTQKVVSLGGSLNAISYKIPADYDLATASCFDEVAIDGFAGDYRNNGFSPVAETENGRFLTSIGSFDPDYPWSNAVSVLGHWPDKALASYFLARRYSTRYTDEESFASLMDLAGVKEEYQNIMANLLAEEPLSAPISLIDENGQAYNSLSGVSVNLHKTVQMESLPPMPRGIYNFLGISSKSRDRISDVILKMGVRQMRSADYKVKGRGESQFDTFTKQQDRYGVISGDKISFNIAGETYVATKANSLAYKHASTLITEDGYQLGTYLDNYTKEELSAILTSVKAAWGDFRTTILPAYQAAVTLYDAPLVNAMVTQMKQDLSMGNDSEASFNTFMNSNISSGDIIYSQADGSVVYKSGKTHSISDVINAYQRSFLLIKFGYEQSMMFAVDNVYAGYEAASVKDKEVWLAGVDIVSAYLDGGLAEITSKNYELLERIPNAEEFPMY